MYALTLSSLFWFVSSHSSPKYYIIRNTQLGSSAAYGHFLHRKNKDNLLTELRDSNSLLRICLNIIHGLNIKFVESE